MDEDGEVGDVSEAIISLTEEEAEVSIPDEAVAAGEWRLAVDKAAGFLAVGAVLLTRLDDANDVTLTDTGGTVAGC